MNFIEYFWTNLGSNVAFTITALIIAIIFVILMEKYFNITLKNPAEFHFSQKNPVGRVPIIKNPVGKVPIIKNPMRKWLIDVIVVEEFTKMKSRKNVKFVEEMIFLLDVV